VVEELIKQEPLSAISPGVQIMALALVFTGFFDKMDIEEVKVKKTKVIEALATREPYKGLADGIKDHKLDEVIETLKGNFAPLEDACRQ
jgi:F0F1-type ATP synthase alpha subunit